MSRYKLVFREEFLNMMTNTPVSQWIAIAKYIPNIADDFFERIQTHYEINFEPYFQICLDYLKSLFSETNSEQMLKEFM